MSDSALSSHSHNPTVFIDWPLFSRNSNGILCLYELSLYLHRSGFAVYGVPRKFRAFLASVNTLPTRFRDIPFTAKPFGSSEDVFIAAETVPRRTMDAVRAQGIRVAWWCLAPFCLLDGTQWPRIGDLSLPYSSYVDPDSERYYYFQPDPDASFKRALAHQKARPILARPRLCIYNGKGRFKKLTRRILDLCRESEIIMITRASPSSRRKLFELLSSSDGLITFDEFSALNLEAAALGLPVFLANPLFPERCRARFSIGKLQDYVVADDEKFCELIAQRRQNKLDPWDLSELTSLNDATLDAWQSLLRVPFAFSDHVVTPDAASRFNDHTKMLTDKRIISVDNGGQAGGVWMSTFYISAISKGRHYKAIMMAARILDYCYMIFGRPIKILEKMPIVRKFLRMKSVDGLLVSYNHGEKIYYSKG